jgi:hypothetical protein
VSQIAQDLRFRTLGGIGMMLTTGPLMLSAEPESLGNVAFHFKMWRLLLALGTHFTIHRWATRPDLAPGTTLGGRLAARLSMMLWTGVVLGGRAIAFF